jgi:hypothetical protein
MAVLTIVMVTVENFEMSFAAKRLDKTVHPDTRTVT